MAWDNGQYVCRSCGAWFQPGVTAVAGGGR